MAIRSNKTGSLKRLKCSNLFVFKHFLLLARFSVSMNLVIKLVENLRVKT